MATFYIQLENKLLQISGDLTAENVSKALGYVPASSNVTNELSQRVDNITFDSLKDNPFLQDGSGELNIVDEAGNIIAKIDANGIHSVDFITGEHRLSNKTDKTYVDEAVKNVKVNLTGYATEEYVNNIDFYNINNNPIVNNGDGKLLFVDENGYIGLQLEEDGLYVKDVIADGHTLSQKADKSDIPSLDGYATESYVNTNLQNYATKDEVSDLVDMSVVTELQGKVNTLINEDSDKSVRTIANEELAALLLAGNDNLQSLQELAAWIDGHPEDASAMNEAIQTNTSNITKLDSAYKEADVKVLTDANEYTDNINFYTIKDNPIVNGEAGSLTFVDETGNIGLQLEADNTLYVKDVISGGHILSNKQDSLISGTTIKTINGESILGSGDITLAIENNTTGNTTIAGKLNLTNIDEIKAAQSALSQTNDVAFYLVTDSNGSIPSTQSCYDIPSANVKQLSLTSPNSITNGVLALATSSVSINAVGVNVGDLVALTRVKVKVSDLTAALGINLSLSGEIEIYQYKILSMNDAKPTGHWEASAGVMGLMSPWDKGQVNKISGIESTANNALPKNDLLPSRWEANMNNALQTGVYPWCDLGRPAGSTGHYTCIVNKTSTDDGAFNTIEQTAYGREAELGQVYKRIIFEKTDGTDTQFGEWIKVSNDNNAENNTHCAIVKSEDYVQIENPSLGFGLSVMCVDATDSPYVVPSFSIGSEILVMDIDYTYVFDVEASTIIAKVPTKSQVYATKEEVNGLKDNYSKIIGTEVKTADLSNYTLVNNHYAGNLVMPYATTSSGGAMSATDKQTLDNVVSTKQDKLVNGVNIKTINGESILGSGNITISGGSSSNSGGNGAYSQINHGTSDTTFTLTPNTFHVWDEIDSLTLTMGDEIVGVANEYLFQFTSGSEPTTLIFPDSIRFNSDFTIEAHTIYQISILNGLGTVISWKFAYINNDGDISGGGYN